MERIRTVIAYKDYFKDFLLSQPQNVQNKIYKIIEIIESHERIPEKFLKQIKGQKGLYETRIMLNKNIWRVFCFFDKGKLVILLNGFQKKSQKIPKKEIERAKKTYERVF